MSLRKAVMPVAAHVRAVERRNEPQPRLGRVYDPVKHAAAPRLASYAASPLPTPPPSVNWAAKANPAWGMYLNNRIGDCTCAAVAHATQLVTSQTGREISPRQGAVLRMYEALSGYDPFTGADDNGCAEPDVLDYWRTTGLGPMHHKIDAYAAVDHTDTATVQQVIALFGFAYVGVNVPQAWLSGPAVWDTSDTPVVGGHAVIFVGYDENGLDLVSWGRVYRMTYPAWAQYGEEAYAAIASEWFTAGELTPSGLDLAGLRNDLDQLRSAA